MFTKPENPDSAVSIPSAFKFTLPMYAVKSVSSLAKIRAGGIA
jgi:hypothetical protein